MGCAAPEAAGNGDGVEAEPAWWSAALASGRRAGNGIERQSRGSHGRQRGPMGCAAPETAGNDDGGTG
jgi:hypothetical protein